MGNRTTSTTLHPLASQGNVSGQDVYPGETVTVTVTTPAGHGGWSATTGNPGRVSLSSSTGNSGTACIITATNAGSYSVVFSSTATTSEGEAGGTISGAVLAPVNGVIPTGLVIAYTSDPEAAGRHISATASGGSGTLQVGPLDGSAWKANGSSFYRTRGTTPALYARSIGTGTGATPSASYGPAYPPITPIPYLATTSQGTVTSSVTSLGYSASATSVTLTGGNVASTHDYRINQGTTSNLTVSVPASTASAVNHVYTLYVRRKQASGGDPNGGWVSSGNSVTINRAAAPSTASPTTIALASATQSASPTNVSVTASGGTTGSVASVGATENGQFFTNGTAGFTATRGVPKTFYAYNTLNTIDSSTVGLSGTLPYLTLGTVANTTISATATSATIAVSGATANASTNIKGYIAGTLTNLAIGTGTGNGALTITSGMPAQYSTTAITLYFYTKTPIADGGNNQWVYKGSFTLTRAAGVAPPTDITFVPLGTEDPLTNVTATVVGPTGDTPKVGLQVISTTGGVVTTGTVAGSGGYHNSPHEFTGLARGNTTTGTTYVYKFWAYNLQSGGDTSTFINRDYTVPYLNNPDLDVTLGADVTITSSSTSDVTISLADYSANTQYRLYNIPEARFVSTYNGSSPATPQFTISYIENELPPSGTTDTTWTYTVQGRHVSTYGGNPNDAFQAFSPPEQVTVTRSAAANTAPSAFDLEASSDLPVVGADQDADFLSDEITVAGLGTSTSTTISISGTGSPTYSKNSGEYTAITGTVVNGNTIRVKVHSASSGNTQVTGTLNIGGVTDTFSVTTASSGTGLGTLPAADYGLELRNASGTLVLKPQARVLNFQGSGEAYVDTLELGVRVSDWVTSPHCNSPSKVLVSVAGGESNPEKCVPETRAHSSANPNLDEWRFKAGTNTQSTVKYIIVRYG